jgi:hypothetical protein
MHSQASPASPPTGNPVHPTGSLRSTVHLIDSGGVKGVEPDCRIEEPLVPTPCRAFPPHRGAHQFAAGPQHHTMTVVERDAVVEKPAVIVTARDGGTENRSARAGWLPTLGFGMCGLRRESKAR